MKKKARWSERKRLSGDLNVMKEQATLLFEGRAKWVEEPSGRGKYKGPVAGDCFEERKKPCMAGVQ